MKLIFFLILAASLQLSAKSYAQISISEKNSSLIKIFKEIQKQSGYDFWYESAVLKKITNIDIDLKNVSLQRAIDECLKGKPLTYVIAGKTVVIKQSQQPVKKEVRGTVSDSTGVLPGVSITVKNKPNVGTATDGNGRYVLDVPDDNVVLVFSMIGYVTQEVPVKNKEIINVVLVSSSNTLNDVVVVAFGTQKKAEMVGSVTTINPKELKVPSSNLTTALAGRLSGVIAFQRSGEPGQDNADFFIRGVTSFGTGKKDPLILIDGVELSVTELARLQSDDIESFSIMKDATSTALYGARGANGVVMVTTKTGKPGKAQVSFRLENSVSAATQNVELADPITYMKMYNDAVISRDPFQDKFYSQEKIDATAEGRNPIIYPAVDWRKELFKDYTSNQRANLSVSGGGQIARYYVTGSYNKDNGILKVDQRNNFNSNIKLNTYTLRSNVNIDLTKSTELIVRLNGNFDDYTGPIEGGTSLYNKVLRSNPVDFPAYYPVDYDHRFVQHIMFGKPASGNQSYINPYADMVKGYKDYSRSLMLAQLELKQNLSFLTQGLSFRTMVNTNRTSFFDVTRAYAPFYYRMTAFDRLSQDYTVTIDNPLTGTEYLDYAEPRKSISSTFYLESALNYGRSFNKHSLSGLLVYIMREGLSVNTDPAVPSSLQLSLPSRNIGLSGRSTYVYDNRYAAEINFGYNGSERFHESKRMGFFPSAGVAWTVSNEKFMKPFSKTITELKLRATYGLVGNDAIGPAADRFFYLSEVNMNDANRAALFGTDFNYKVNGITVNRYSNTDITWETAYKTNFALELGLFNEVKILADVYTERRKNILMTRGDIPSTMGLSSIVRANVGEASGKGIDLSVDYSHSFGNKMWLQTRGNFTFAKNRFEIYEEPSYEKEYWLSRVGYPIAQQWGYIAERLFIDDSEVANSPAQNFGGQNIAGDIKYKDVNNDGQITALDKVPLGHPTTPEIVYGLGFSLGYKNFDISTFFQGLSNESFWVSPANVQPFNGGRQVLKAYADSHWSMENPDLYALMPRLDPTYNENNNQLSTWWLRNGAFIRLKQAEIGYSLSPKIASRLKMSKARVYINGSNLFMLSHFKLWDVEVGGNGLGYPLQRVFNTGLNITF